MLYVYSTLTNAHKYTNWILPTSDGQLPRVDGTPVEIKGGANLATKAQITPLGVRTEITEDQNAYLMRNNHFLKHVKDGYLIVKDQQQEADFVAMSEMAAQDKAAPLTPNSEIFQSEEEDAPKPEKKSRIKGAIKGAFS